MTPLCHLVVVMVTLGCFTTNFALHVELSPLTARVLVTDQVNITCRAHDAPDETLKVLVLSLGKSGQAPLATLSHEHDVVYGQNKDANMLAEGIITKNASDSYLTLTVTKPGVEDGGLYWCRMYYIDVFGQMKEEKEFDNLTVEMCPEGWQFYQDDMTCVKVFVKVRRVWSEARKDCQSYGGDLVIIKDEKKNAFVMDLLNATNYWVWIGVTKEADTGHDFKYVDGSSVGSFQPWIPYLLDDTENSRCVAMAHPSIDYGYGGKWDDDPCYVSYHYVCSVKAV